MRTSPTKIRNFAITAHIDHGKSTLADRLMEAAGVLPPLAQPSGHLAPRIDRMELETERGVTIKLKAVRLPYTLNSRPYTLNMIDTPGHADFSYEVSRALAACEGILLLVDATAGVQAQTISHFAKAQELGLAVIGVVNKVDSPLAKVEETERQMRDLGVTGEILKISALAGWGIEDVLQAIATRVPDPKGSVSEPFRALVFDSLFDSHLGVVAYVRVVDGELEISKKQKSIKFLGTGVEAKIKEAGFFTPDRSPSDSLSAGEVGYLATGLRDPQSVRVGDTVIQEISDKQEAVRTKPLPGYEPPQSFVFASFFARNTDFEELSKALAKLRLEEPAISLEEISSVAFGRGFRIGFLGTFHLEIVRERLMREFGLELIVTKPTVPLPNLEEEPWIRLLIITAPEYLVSVTKSILVKRGQIGETTSLGNRLKVSAELPLLEFIRGFYDSLKSVSSGYASLSWEFLGYRKADLANLEILIHGESVEGLSEIVFKGDAEKLAREKLVKLKDLLPREQFSYAVQAKVGGKIIAREDIPAYRRDVLAKLSGGHVERKMKKLGEQKKGKKRLAKFGHVDIPPEAFLV